MDTVHRRYGNHRVRVGPHFLRVPKKRCRARAVTSGMRDAILKAQNMRCAGCDSVVREIQSTGHALFDIDHVVPHSLGGPCEPPNLVALCLACHRAKTTLEAAHCGCVGRRVRDLTKRMRRNGSAAARDALLCFWCLDVVSPYFEASHRCAPGKGPFIIMDELSHQIIETTTTREPSLHRGGRRDCFGSYGRGSPQVLDGRREDMNHSHTKQYTNQRRVHRHLRRSTPCGVEHTEEHHNEEHHNEEYYNEEHAFPMMAFFAPQLARRQTHLRRRFARFEFDTH